LTTNSDIGLRSPIILNLRLNGVLSIEDRAYNVFAERLFGDHLVRAGVLGQGRDFVGGFAGGKVDTENLGLDLDVGYHSELDARGFISAESGKLYLSLGGNSYEKSLSSFIGTTSEGKPGLMVYTNADLDDNVYSGKIFLGSSSTWNKDTLDFCMHIKTGTEMERVTSGGILDSWPPFDAFRSDRFSLVGSYSVSEGELTGGVRGYYVTGRDFILGLGVNEEESTSVSLELLSHVPSTPFEAWVEANMDETEELWGRAYVGGMWKW
jgi:hypothetical protein